MSEVLIRANEKKAIYNSCLEYEPFKTLSLKSQIKLVTLIESSILNAAIDKCRERNIPIYWESDKFIEQYSNIGYLIKINLDITSTINKAKKPETRSYLISRLYNYIILDWINIPILTKWVEVINPKKVGYMNSITLNPEINKSYLNELNLRVNQTIKVKYSKMYTCSQCKEKKTQMREIQTRSSDEGGTLFINCIVCGHTWRQY